MTDTPDQLWKSCVFGAEGKVHAEGEGTVDLGDRFTISANGMLIEVVVTSWSSDRTWVALDVESFERGRRVPDEDRGSMSTDGEGGE